MATTALYTVEKQARAKAPVAAGAWMSCALTPIAIVIHGFHPYAEDGGVYLAGVKKLLDPELYPYLPGFVTTHLRFSLFAPAVAALVHATHLGLMPVVFALYAASIWLTLFSGWILAMQCWTGMRACCGAVCVLAIALTAPVAGTSLILMDPYLTARSVSTPLGLLALAAALKMMEGVKSNKTDGRAAFACVGCIIVAAAAHPLMAAYSVGCVVVLICVSLSSRTTRIWATATVCAAAFVLAASLQWLGPRENEAYSLVAGTRTYWFLSNWKWYEIFGLVAPIVLLLILERVRGLKEDSAGRRLAWMAAICGSVAAAIVAIFVRVHAANYLVAKLQPLRVYETIYAVMFLAIGAFLAERILKASIVGWLALMLAGGALMLAVQFETFPHSAHIEFPGKAPVNAWEQAFEWARTHTDKSAVFALDANYITAGGEDSQNFRVIAERSALPDFAKDGGIASIAPTLTREWQMGEAMQVGLDGGVDQEKIASLYARGVKWLIVLRTTPVAQPCAYTNDIVKVCPVYEGTDPD